jgi:hypothetical protein
MKERVVRDAKGRGDTDLLTTIENYRGDQVVATVMLRSGRDDTLAVVRACAMGFGPDVLAAIWETWAVPGEEDAKSPEEIVNPVTGRPFEDGDMARLVAEHDGLAKGWITEALLVHVANRAGDTGSGALQYAIKGRRVEWGLSTSDAGLQGRVADRLAAVMTEATVAQEASVVLPKLMAELGEERALAQMDAASVTLIGELVPLAIVLLDAKSGSIRDQVLKARLPKSWVVPPPDLS